MNAYLYVAFGGALGSVARYACTEWVDGRLGGFPWGTLLVNVLGSMLIGVLMGWGDGGRGLSESARQFLMGGILGGFTTFSSFSLQTVLLLRSGAVMDAVLNVVLSVGACLLATWAGWALMQKLS